MNHFMNFRIICRRIVQLTGQSYRVLWNNRTKIERERKQERKRVKASQRVRARRETKSFSKFRFGRCPSWFQ